MYVPMQIALELEEFGHRNRVRRAAIVRRHVAARQFANDAQGIPADRARTVWSARTRIGS
jgi:hypothetical protein